MILPCNIPAAPLGYFGPCRLTSSFGRVGPELADTFYDLIAGRWTDLASRIDSHIPHNSMSQVIFFIETWLIFQPSPTQFFSPKVRFCVNWSMNIDSHYGAPQTGKLLVINNIFKLDHYEHVNHKNSATHKSPSRQISILVPWVGRLCRAFKLPVSSRSTSR